MRYHRPVRWGVKIYLLVAAVTALVAATITTVVLLAVTQGA